MTKAIRVTVEDLENGDKDSTEISGDYVIITAEPAYVSNIQHYINGTAVITVKGRIGPSVGLSVNKKYEEKY